MTNGPSQDEPSFGFLTILEDATGGLLGGLLLVNRRGRPLEFHCTAPICPSRAEEILFGPTLRPHLFCERIGAALLAKASGAPSVLLVSQLDTWPIADETTVPVALVDPRTSDASTSAEVQPMSQSQACLDRLDPATRVKVQELLQEFSRYVDLAEPFERITEAIREAGLLDDNLHEEATTGDTSHDAAA